MSVTHRLLTQRSIPGAFAIRQLDTYIVDLTHEVNGQTIRMSLGQLDELVGCALAYQVKAHNNLQAARDELAKLQDREDTNEYHEGTIRMVEEYISITSNELRGVPRSVTEESAYPALQRAALIQQGEEWAKQRYVSQLKESGNVLIDRATLDALVGATKTYISDREGAPCEWEHKAIKKAEAALGHEAYRADPSGFKNKVRASLTEDKNDILDNMTDLYREWFQTTPYDDQPIPDARELLAGLRERMNTDREEDWTPAHIQFLTYFTRAWELIESL